MKNLKLISFILIVLGFALLILPNSKTYRNYWDKTIPYFHNLNEGYTLLTTFEAERSEPDGHKREKFLGPNDVGFSEIVRVLRSNTDKLDGIDVQNVTNRREVSILDDSGDQRNLLTVVFAHSSSIFPPIILITSESELFKWIQNFKVRWMLIFSGIFIVLGIGGLLIREARLRKVTFVRSILMILVLFLAVPIASYCNGSLQWKDLLSYIWIIPVTIVALFQDILRKKIAEPRLGIEFNLGPPHCQKTPMTHSVSGQRVGDAYYFRFRVKNTGNGQARLCQVVIESLSRKRELAWIKDEKFQPMNLQWSNNKSIDEFLHISPQMPGWFCDLVHIETYREKEKIWIDYKQPIPHSQPLVLDCKVNYKMDVAVYCENAKEVRRSFEIYWSGKWDDEPNIMYRETSVRMY